MDLKMENDISLYIPVFNGEKTIESCLESVLNQTLKPKSILVIDDNSTDKTKEILNKYKEQIEIISNKENKGLSYSRNFAVNYLKTKYIASIDADVVLSREWLERVLKSLLKNNASLVGGKMYEKYINNPCNLWRSIRLKQNWGESDILNPDLVFGCNNVLNTSNLDLRKIYNNNSEYYKLNGEDTELCKFLKKKNYTLFYNSSAVCYHLQDDNYNSLANRYWRYVQYGDGFKKKNFLKILKNIIRQIKKTFKWSFEDILNLRLKLLKINFVILYYFIKKDFHYFFSKE